MRLSGCALAERVVLTKLYGGDAYNQGNLREMEFAGPAFRKKYLPETQTLIEDVLTGCSAIGAPRVEYERAFAKYRQEL